MEQAEQPTSMKFEKGDATAGFSDDEVNTPLGPMIGVAAIALNMAMKYHDINTVADGALYQQYKIEGRNMVPLHLDMVFDTAMQIERHLISGNKRVAKLMVAAVLEDHTDGEPDATTGKSDEIGSDQESES
jgi:hypothetical protein